MKLILFALAVVGVISLASGIAIALLSPHSIHCTGRIVYPDEELKSTENDSPTFMNAEGYMPIIVGVGLLSTVLLYGIVENKRK